jgi:hypothetical protein
MPLAVAIQRADVRHVRSPSVPRLPSRHRDMHDVATNPHPPNTARPHLDRRGFKIQSTKPSVISRRALNPSLGGSITLHMAYPLFLPLAMAAASL